MKILLINTYRSGGGAAVACQRTMQLLRRAGVEVRMLTISEFGWRHRVSFLAERLDTLRAIGYRRQNLFRFSTARYGLDIAHHPWVAWAEVIHIHWVQQGFLSIGGLSELLSIKGKRFFWTLHDFWPLTGGCHIPYTIKASGETSFCQRFMEGCGSCPLLGGRRKDDDSSRLFQAKRRLPLEQMHLVAVSNAVAKAADASPLFRRSPITVLHNPIDLKLFCPDSIVRKREGNLLLVAARIDDRVKGPDLLLQMLRQAKALSEEWASKSSITLVGQIKDKSLLEQIPIAYQHIHRAEGEQLVQLYREASTILSTSRYETLGQTLVEGIACGTPAIAFGVGGIPDIIRPESGNGQLIQPYDTAAMARAVVRSVPPIGEGQIADTVRSFGIDTIAPQLLHLYSL
ncbi:glycosyltransferase [uncultured Porphyromonas sp.]|uniref:glycosyltransferase n=1 Tax=uncultured Porphyromonas sp. TaxID=159274 RepID=UPI002637E7D0|nr:glycosyltransferase [uncultured Porphyromonas sp.]